VDALRVKHGQGSFWGDLNHIETRLVYHQLLPRHLLQVRGVWRDGYVCMDALYIYMCVCVCVYR
jgi:hypothetical protein